MDLHGATEIGVAEARLAEYTAQVERDARIPQALRAWERHSAAANPVPVPKKMGDPSVFEHVVYIIKENRTYDHSSKEKRKWS